MVVRVSEPHSPYSFFPSGDSPPDGMYTWKLKIVYKSITGKGISSTSSAQKLTEIRFLFYKLLFIPMGVAKCAIECFVIFYVPQNEFGACTTRRTDDDVSILK